VTTPASALLPIFRSEAQARILAWLLLDTSREQPIAHLSRVAGVAQPNTLREVNRLVEAELLAERRAGNTRLVRANPDSPFFEPLVAILSRAYGPASIVPEVLGGLAGVEQVVLIGSWAERFLGTPGPPPRDLDVVVVGQPDRRRLRAANRELEERLGQAVQLTAVSDQEWEDASTGFTQTAKERPHVVVVDNTRTAA
jgi:DNA-binding transcriptional ArsR family regulator